MTTATDYTGWTSAPLLELVRSLAVSVTAGNHDQADDLAAAARELNWRAHSGRTRPGPRADSGLPHVDLMRRVTFESHGFLAVPAGEVRRALGTRSLAGLNLCSVPAALPDEDDVPVLLYNGLAVVGSLLGAIARGEDATEAYRAVEDLAVHRRPWPVEH
ncbi:hypothetical protein ACIQTN_33875 [Streptomyces werraensis]|uniref:hypothetical protein n=1 Tax=Streptomyces werraensis TaxID=68284 RepID=UPI0037F7E346